MSDEFSLTARVSIDQTPISGVRNAASSEWSYFQAPEEHVINKEAAVVNWEHDCTEERYDMVWDNWAEIVPGTGLKLPRRLAIRVHGCSKHGPLSGGAWARLTVSGVIVKYTRFEVS